MANVLCRGQWGAASTDPPLGAVERASTRNTRVRFPSPASVLSKLLEYISHGFSTESSANVVQICPIAVAVPADALRLRNSAGKHLPIAENCKTSSGHGDVPPSSGRPLHSLGARHCHISYFEPDPRIAGCWGVAGEGVGRCGVGEGDTWSPPGSAASAGGTGRPASAYAASSNWPLKATE